MAKMFYTVEEAAAKLGKSVEVVRELAASGQLQEFRDRDKLVFKREQVDLLSGGGDEEGSIPLADSGEITLASDDSKSGSGGMASPGGSGGGSGNSTKERSGISIFEADELEEADASAQTQVTSTVQGLPGGDPGASGSGLLDVTRSDDTSLGAGLLADVYGGGKDDTGEAAAVGADAGGGALFESSGVNSDVSGSGMGGGMMMVAAESYDGLWSGIAGGLALAMVIIVGLMVAVVILALVGGVGSGLAPMLAANFMPVVGGMAGLALVCAGVGFFLGKKG